MIDLESMSDEDKIERLEHIVAQFNDMLAQCDIGEPYDDIIREIFAGNEWGEAY